MPATIGHRRLSLLVLLPLFCAAVPDVLGNPSRQAAPGVGARVAVVLSGGGARGASHIGVLRELEKTGVPIDIIVGSSFGALVGGLYCAGYSTDDLELILRSIDWNLLLSNASKREFLDVDRKMTSNRKLVELQFENLEPKFPIGLQAGQKVQQMLDRLTAQLVLEADNDFDKLPIRFRAVATNILTGEPRVFRSGPLSTAIRGSAAVPGLFAPVRLEETLLVDGGIVSNMPVGIARAMGADVVIAVDASSPLKTRTEEFESLIDVLNQVIGFQVEEHTEPERRQADVVIAPMVPDVGVTDFDKSASLIEAGVEAAHRALPQIARVLEEAHVARRPTNGRTSRLDSATFDWETFELPAEPIILKEVRVEGLKVYPATVVLDRVSARSGARVSPGSIDRDVSQLYGSGLFLGVTYRLEKGSDDALLIFDVTEKPPMRIGFGFRYDRDYQLSAIIDLYDHHFIGPRSEWFFRALVGNAKNVELGMSQDLGDRNLMASAEVQYFSQPRMIFDGGRRIGDYQDRRYVARVSLQNLLANAARIQLAYTVERVDIDRGVGMLAQNSRKTLAGLQGGVEVDTLDDFDFATSGLLGKVELDWQDPRLGSDFAFRRASASIQHYLSLQPENTIGLSGTAGHIDGDVPLYEMFYVGGAQNFTFSSLRFPGLARDEIVTGKYAIVGVSARRRVRHFQSGPARGVYVSASYNAGRFDGRDPVSRFGETIHGLGVGLSLDLRYAGPLRFEAGRTNTGGVRTYLSLGRQF